MLKGKVCFVSGAARGRGNGRAIALKMAQKGAMWLLEIFFMRKHRV